MSLIAACVLDYEEEDLERTEEGKILVLEHLINYGANSRKIKLSVVKKYWKKLHLFPRQKMLFELLIWGKIKTRLITTSKPDDKKVGYLVNVTPVPLGLN